MRTRIPHGIGLGTIVLALAGCAGGGVASDPLSACSAAIDCVADDDGAPDDDAADDADDDGTATDGSEGGGDEGDPGGGDPVPGLPCDVRDVLVAECGQCHGDPPKFGAPMPLVDYADLQVPAASDPTRPVFELVGERLVADASPMPPGGEIEDAARDVLLEWIELGAPEDPAADCDAPPDPTGEEPTGPDALPCEPSATLVAHAQGGAGKFVVPTVGAEDLYQCFAFQSPFAAGAQATAWAPVIDDERVVHHWILYRTDSPPQGDVFPCDVSLQVSTDFVAGWAPGGGNVVMPDGVGLELGGPDTWFILQVHYHNEAMYDDALDSSGVAFCVADEPRPNTAGVLTLGTTSIAIPPGATGHQEIGECGFLSTVFWPPMHIIGASPHMHEHGRAMKTELLREGGGVDIVVDVPQFDFNSQLMYLLDQELVLQPGEVLRTTCTYDNAGGSTVTFGEGTGDEMCFDFVLAWPIDQLGNRNCGILF
jgi:hypothetical protein